MLTKYYRAKNVVSNTIMNESKECNKLCFNLKTTSIKVQHKMFIYYILTLGKENRIIKGKRTISLYTLVVQIN